LGRQFPSVIQDYSYALTRDWTKLIKYGRQHEPGCRTKITPVTQPQFTTIREMDEFDQADKDVSTIGESTHTIEVYTADFAPGETPSIKVITRQGQFEQFFMYVDILKESSRNAIMPSKSPIIKTLQYFVRGKENRFVRELSRFDLERMSRSNCHELSDWRTYHEAGRGLLIHLADLGLTEADPFPFRDRVELEFKLLGIQEPELETDGQDTTLFTETNKRRFTIALIRHNQLLKGNIRDMRFKFLNEN